VSARALRGLDTSALPVQAEPEDVLGDQGRAVATRARCKPQLAGQRVQAPLQGSLLTYTAGELGPRCRPRCNCAQISVARNQCAHKLSLTPETRRVLERATVEHDAVSASQVGGDQRGAMQRELQVVPRDLSSLS